MPSDRPLRVIISGGGTGGHVFPAIAIANAIKKMEPQAKILFVGAQDKIEMRKVPEAGYPIEGLWISGFHRKKMSRNLTMPFKLISSMWRSYSILRKFKPDLAIGVGGYASGPLMQAATSKGIPSLVQEQNSFPGVTNKWLSSKVDKICVVYKGMEKYFPAEKIIQTGNPVRDVIINNPFTMKESLAHFGLQANLKTVFVTGGSLGARSVNACIAAHIDFFVENNIQLIWQTGELYIEDYRHLSKGHESLIKIMPFVRDMSKAYNVADLVVTRAGGIISELCIVGKAVILIPSPNVAEDHQTYNAKSLVKEDAAILVPDMNMERELFATIARVLGDDQRRAELGSNIKKLAITMPRIELLKKVYVSFKIEWPDKLELVRGHTTSVFHRDWWNWDERLGALLYFNGSKSGWV